MLGGLTPYGKQYYGHLLSSFKLGYKAKPLHGVVQKNVPNYKWGQFRRDWGIVRRAYERSQKMKFVPRAKMPSEEHYIPSPFHRAKNYYSVMKVKVWDKELLKEDYLHVTITHDTRLARYELEDAAREWLIEPSERFEYLDSAIAIGYRKSD